MKKGILVLALFACFFSCKKENTDSNPSIWKLTEMLLDPGDGSGVFMPVTSDKTIRLFDDGTFTCTGDLCSLGIESDGETTGTYSLSDSRIETSECTLGLSINGDFLGLGYPCDEPCIARYQKQ